MCEIVVLDPERTDNESIHQLGALLLEEQGDGLGVLAVQTDGEEFTYEVYRHTNPSWWAFEQFLRRTRSSTWRYVIHGRASTGGGVKRDHAHPLPVDCPECEAEWVVHNGSVRNEQQNRASLTGAGHSFETEVDSEIIPHKVGSLPDTVEDHDGTTYNMHGNLNYLVFFPDGILAKFSKKYYTTDDFVVVCGNRKRSEEVEENYDELDNDHEWFRITPDKEIERTEHTTTTGAYSGNSTTGTGSRSRTTTPGATNRNINTSVENGEDDQVAVVYDELVPNLPGVSAVKVAPGVIRLADLNAKDDNEEFIFRRDEPGLYYYYATDEQPDHTQVGLEALFDGDGNLREADEIIEEAGGSLDFDELADLLGADADAAEAAQQVADETIQAIREREAAACDLPEDPDATITAADVPDDGVGPDVQRHMDTVVGGDEDGDFLTAREYDLAFTALLDRYGSEATALRKMEKMSREGIQQLAANPGLAEPDVRTKKA